MAKELDELAYNPPQETENSRLHLLDEFNTERTSDTRSPERTGFPEAPASSLARTFSPRDTANLAGSVLLIPNVLKELTKPPKAEPKVELPSEHQKAPEQQVSSNYSKQLGDDVRASFDKDGLRRLTHGNGAVTEFTTDASGNPVISGEKPDRTIQQLDGKWQLKDGGQTFYLKEAPTINQKGEYSATLRDGSRVTFKPDGSAVTETDGRVTRIDYADKSSTSFEWKDGQVQVERNRRADGSLAEQYQHDPSTNTYLRFTWAEGAKSDKYTGAYTAITGVAPQRDGTTNHSDSTGTTRQYSDKGKARTDNQGRLTEIIGKDGSSLWKVEYNWGASSKPSAFTDRNGNRFPLDQNGETYLRLADGRSVKIETKADAKSFMFRINDRQDPNWQGIKHDGTAFEETPGGGRQTTYTDGTKKVSYTSGRVVELSKDNQPTRITEPDGTAWSLSDAGKNEWRSDKGAKRTQTVNDGTITYTTANGAKRIDYPDGTSTVKNGDKSTVDLRDGKITKVTAADGNQTTFEYDRSNQPTKISDERGRSWQRTSDSKWILSDSRKQSEELKGSLRIHTDGSVSFTGKNQRGESVAIDYKTNGATIEHKQDNIKLVQPDGTTVDVQQGKRDEKNIPTRIRVTDTDGKVVDEYTQSDGEGQRWKSNRGERTAELKLDLERGTVGFTAKAGSGATTDIDIRGRPQSITYPDNRKVSLDYDRDGKVSRFSVSKPGAASTETWAKQENSNWWLDSEGKNPTYMHQPKIENDYNFSYQAGGKDVSLNRWGERTERNSTRPLDYAILRQDMLSRANETIPAGDRLNKFYQNLSELESSSRTPKLSQQELAATYAEISRLLYLKTGQSTDIATRAIIAEQFMRQAATPTSIDQGAHNTCSVATAEIMMYTKSPSIAARILADVATNGKLVTKDGTTIVMPTGFSNADIESQFHPPANGQRGYASQLLQGALTNVHWQRYQNGDNLYTNSATKLGKVEKGSVWFTQLAVGDFPNDGRERVMYQAPGASAGTPLMEKTKDGTIVTLKHPQLNLQALGQIWDQVANSREHFYGLYAAETNTNVNRIESVNNENKLHDALQSLRAGTDGNSFPVSVTLHSSVGPFRGVSNHGWHSVTVTGYDPATKSVYIDNQWGSYNDHLGQNGTKRPLTLSELYESMAYKGK